MATIDEYLLGQVLDVLRPSLRSVELRAVAVELGGQWELAGGVLAVTRASVEAVRTAQIEFRSASSIPEADHFEIVMGVVPIDNVDDILRSLVSGVLPFNGRTFHLTDSATLYPWLPLTMQGMRGSHGLSLASDSGIFPRYTTSLRLMRHPEDVLRDAGFEPSNLGLSAWWELNEFMGMAFFARDDTLVRLGLALSVYAAFDPTPTIRDATARVELRTHKSLSAAVTVRGSIRQSGAMQTYPTASRKLPLPSPLGTDDVEIFDLKMPLDLGQLGSQDHVEFALFLAGLGQLNLAPPTRLFPAQMSAFGANALLIKAFGCFEGAHRLGEYLSQSRQVKNQPLLSFEAGVVLTLSAIGLHYFPLMVYQDAEHIRDNGHDVASADVIAEDPGAGLLVIDCTLTVPDLTKIQKLRNTVQFLSSRLEAPCRGILICAADITLFRRDSGQYGVAFVDASHLRAIWDIAQSGNTVLALNHFRALIHQTPAVGQL